MTFRAKQRAVFIFLVALVAWPFAHHALVQAWQIDPWSFGGWAMYCTPRLDLRVGASGYRGGLPLRQQVPQSLAPAATAYGERRMSYGRFVAPDALAEEILAEMPAADGVVVLIEKRRLDPASATIRASATSTATRVLPWSSARTVRSVRRSGSGPQRGLFSAAGSAPVLR